MLSPQPHTQPCVPSTAHRPSQVLGSVWWFHASVFPAIIDTPALHQWPALSSSITSAEYPSSPVQSFSHVQLFVTPWTVTFQASLSITISWSLLTLVSIESVMPSNHLILCRPLLLLPSTFPSIRVFSSESVLQIRWPKHWSFSFSISPSNEHSGLISFQESSN